jgi:uncharacterized membrane protein
VCASGCSRHVPFTLALLVMALLSEFAAVRGRWLALRPVVAAAADFATLMRIIILGDFGASPRNTILRVPAS